MAFHVTLPPFEGPLEVLLNLIEDRKLSISEISLAEVTDGYIAHVEKLPELPLGETAQFILVASTLLLIKSRSLLPLLEMSPEERESVEELERRLARYAIVRKASRALRKEWGTSPLRFPRHAPDAPLVFAPGSIALERIKNAAMRLIGALPRPEQLAGAAVAPVLVLEDVIASLKARLVTAFRSTFQELTQQREKDEVIVYFLAMLELVRSGSVSATQRHLFSDITLESEETAAPRYGV